MKPKRSDKLKQFKQKLRHGITTFKYKKKSNGKIRTAVGTLDPKIIPNYKKTEQPPKHKTPSDSVIYYDMEKGEIRSFKDYLLLKVKSHSDNVKEMADKHNREKQKKAEDIKQKMNKSQKS